MATTTHKELETKQMAPPGGTPTLAQLAYSRLGFGALPGAPDFDDLTSLAAYVDAQLNYTAVDDADCINYIANFNRTFTVTGTGGVTQTTTLPPPWATLREVYGWVVSLPAGVTSPAYTSRVLRAYTYARATLSKRQLFEVMADFWSNHFNTVTDTTYTKYWEDHAVIRRHALGNFRDLIGASAKSPTMLVYLSNYASDGNNPNENYARELLELHTLGTTNKNQNDARYGQPNYSEDDVHQLAYLLTGWTYVGSAGSEFNFYWPMHNSAGRTLMLGESTPLYVPMGGMEQGEMVLDKLSEDPRTAYMISFKLCRRFISDDPQSYCPQVIQDGADAFISSHGDIKTVVRTIILANYPGADFKSSFGQKVKRPLEFYASALRALGSDTAAPVALYDIAQNGDLATYTGTLGQILFGCPPPTGYPDVMQAWWNANQLYTRLSLANRIIRLLFGELDQGNNTINPAQNARLDAILGVVNAVGPDSATAVDRLTSRLIGRSITSADRQSLISYLALSNTPTNVTSTNNRIRQVIGTLLASPYFQYR